MKYIAQATIILAFTFAGEILNRIIPLPIPASIYGMMILLVALLAGWIKLSAIKETGKFFIEIMPLLFIAPAVGLLESWQTMQEFLAAFIAITLISTITVTAAAGHVTQYIIKLKNRQKK